MSNKSKIKLPQALVPPRHHVPGIPVAGGRSLTIATLRSIEDRVPFQLSIAADIASTRAYFAGIPGVLS